MNSIVHSEEKEGRDKIFDLIKDIRIAQLITQSGDGQLCARPMSAVEYDDVDGALWFYTSIDSAKVAEIEYNPHVLLSYSEPSEQNYVSISGTAEIITDHTKIKELWFEPVRIWFPDGPDDPNLALLRVTPYSAEYWDAPAKSFVYAFGYIRQRLTGKAPKTGDHGKINMH
ncbi:MAG TPA: pyridoxamine 5'-phosphate oxidase family protein [Alphaproteobacteria bacterium]